MNITATALDNLIAAKAIIEAAIDMRDTCLIGFAQHPHDVWDVIVSTSGIGGSFDGYVQYRVDTITGSVARLTTNEWASLRKIWDRMAR